MDKPPTIPPTQGNDMVPTEMDMDNPYDIEEKHRKPDTQSMPHIRAATAELGFGNLRGTFHWLHWPPEVHGHEACQREVGKSFTEPTP